MVRGTERPAMTIAVDLGRKEKKIGKIYALSLELLQIKAMQRNDCKTRKDPEFRTTKQGPYPLSEPRLCVCMQQRLWRVCAYALARMNLRCSHMQNELKSYELAYFYTIIV